MRQELILNDIISLYAIMLVESSSDNFSGQTIEDGQHFDNPIERKPKYYVKEQASPSRAVEKVSTNGK